MPYELSWYVENRILYLRLLGEVTFAELDLVSREANVMIDGGVRPVHALVDLRGVTEFPTNIKDVYDAIHMNRGDNLGWTLIITPSRVLRFFGSTIVQLAQRRINTFVNWEEALAFLATRDDSIKLNDLPPIPLAK
jgi:hypothetical protein